MNAKVNDLMVENVLTAKPDETIGMVRKRMLKKNIHCLPVIDADEHPVGIIASSDFVGLVGDETLVSDVMIDKVYSVSRYDDVHVAARIMRNHKIHHVVVTHEQKVSGIISSFDLLELVQKHRFMVKNPPLESSRRMAKCV